MHYCITEPSAASPYTCILCPGWLSYKTLLLPCSEELRERLSKYHVMLEEQQGTNYRLTEELAAKGDQILQLKESLDLRKTGQQGTIPCLV